MPVLYRVEPDLNLVYYAGFGHCQGGEMITAERQASQSALRHPGMNIIVDLLGVTELDIDLPDYFYLVELNKQQVARGVQPEKTAFISQNGLAVVAAGTLELLADRIPLKMNVVQTLPDAIRWLGLHDADGVVSQLQGELVREFRASLPLVA